nr:MarR family winged helix-turn-helix transcriptional regulator [uncultured Ruminococcus sp.]
MNSLTNYIDYKNLVNANLNYIEAVFNGLYKYAEDAIANNRVNEVVEDFRKISNEFERIRNSLNFDDDLNRKSYFFGKITSLSSLVIDLSNALDTAASYESLFKDYPILRPVLKEISKESEISGAKLRKQLGLSASSLTNFMRRIDNYNLIIVHKVGRSNYYSLSPKGKKALAMPDNINHQSNSEKLTTKYMIMMLDSIADEMRNDQPNTISVLIQSSLYELDISDKNILKNKVDAVFRSRDAHVKNKLYKAVRIWTQYTFEAKRELPYIHEEDSDIYSYEGTY